MKNGSICRVLMVSGINLELKSEEEQNAVIFSYQGFLNSLDFPVQFLVHSRKLNIEGYLEEISRRKESETNELLKNQVAEYSEFIRSFVESNAVMSKNFCDRALLSDNGAAKRQKMFDFLKLGGRISSSRSGRSNFGTKNGSA